MKSNLKELVKDAIGGTLPRSTGESIAERIAESLIRSGKVIVLPHKLDSDVWCLVTPCGDCDDHIPFEECQSCNKWKVERMKFDLEMVDCWGEDVFPTEEEAKQALKEKVKEK